MSRTLFSFSCFIVFAAAFSLNGCGGGDSSGNNSSGDGADNHADHDHDDSDEHAHGEDAQKIAEALAKLSDEDRKLAEAQKTCPIGGGALGAMGTPIKLDVKGQPVFICCEGCKDAVTDDPDGTLAKLKKE